MARDIKELIERVEVAMEPNFELEGSLHSALRPDWPCEVLPPAYTASVDAVIGLIGEKMPGVRSRLDFTADNGAAAMIGFIGKWEIAPTPALALLLAFLRAWESRDA